MKPFIYLDNNATTKVDPSVVKAMLIDLEGDPSNPSSIHHFGQKARGLLGQARHQISSFFRVHPEEIIFTSGATEALNMVIRGVFGYQTKGRIITTEIEHASVYQTVLDLQRAGCNIDFIPTGRWGAPKPEQIENAIKSDTRLIVLSAANSETGVFTDIEKIADIAQKNDLPFIIDGVALLGKAPIHIPKGCSAICFSAHKVHGPKGIGIAIILKPQWVSPLYTGGTQELGKRPGTENIAGILGFAKAVELIERHGNKAYQQMQSLRNYFEEQLLKRIDQIYINGEGPRICNTSNISFLHIDSHALLIHLDKQNIAASTSSACQVGDNKPSRILTKMGLELSRISSAIRFSLSRHTQKEEIDEALERIVHIVNKLRKRF